MQRHGLASVFSYIAKENAALSAVFDISTAQKLLLEMGATNRHCRACFWLMNLRLILDDAIDWAEQTSYPFKISERDFAVKF